MWQIEADGTALHLQSRWRCPAGFGDYVRDDLHLYDRYGLDVSCNYRNKNQRGDITLYLTKATGGDLEATFKGAREAMRKRTADSVPLPDKDQITFESDRPWLHMIHSIFGDKARDGVWYAWMGDWMFEIRATYYTEDEAAEMALLSRVTAAGAAAARHLERCAKSQIPVRNGKLVTDPAEQQATALMYEAMSGPIVVEDETKQATAPMPDKSPPEWCAEAPVGGSMGPVLMWHAINADGRTLPLDRVSLMTMGPAPFLESTEPLGAAFSGGLEIADPKFVVSYPQGDESFVYAVYTGRPDGKALAALLAEVLDHKAKPLAKVNAKTNNITVFTDPNQKD